eukprot:1254396-Prymnesium_polylepis.2
MQGDVNSKMTQGIDDSAVIVVFITNQYIRKVAGDGAAGADDNCKMEFDYALLRKGVRKIVAVVMEPDLRDTKTWTGVVGAKLGTSLYCDCSDNEATASFAKTVEQLAGEIRTRSRDGHRLSTRSTTGFDALRPSSKSLSLIEPLSHYWTATSHK